MASSSEKGAFPEPSPLTRVPEPYARFVVDNPTPFYAPFCARWQKSYAYASVAMRYSITLDMTMDQFKVDMEELLEQEYNQEMMREEEENDEEDEEECKAEKIKQMCAGQFDEEEDNKNEYKEDPKSPFGQPVITFGKPAGIVPASIKRLPTSKIKKGPLQFPIKPTDMKHADVLKRSKVKPVAVTITAVDAMGFPVYGEANPISCGTYGKGKKPLRWICTPPPTDLSELDSDPNDLIEGIKELLFRAAGMKPKGPPGSDKDDPTAECFKKAGYVPTQDLFMQFKFHYEKSKDDDEQTENEDSNQKKTGRKKSGKKRGKKDPNNDDESRSNKQSENGNSQSKSRPVSGYQSGSEPGGNPVYSGYPSEASGYTSRSQSAYTSRNQSTCPSGATSRSQSAKVNGDNNGRRGSLGAGAGAGISAGEGSQSTNKCPWYNQKQTGEEQPENDPASPTVAPVQPADPTWEKWMRMPLENRYNLPPCHPLYPTVKQDILGEILQGVFDERDEGEDDPRFEEWNNVLKGLVQLKQEVAGNRWFRRLCSDAPDVPAWNKFLVERSRTEGQPKLRWLATVWLYTECYLYRRIVEVFERIDSLRNFDPYASAKEKLFERALEGMDKVAKDFLQIVALCPLPPPYHRDTGAYLRMFLYMSLWGDRPDITKGGPKSVISDFTGGNPLLRALTYGASVLVDESDRVWQTLLDEQLNQWRRVDIVTDNAGFELFADLCLADFLVSYRLVDWVVIHVKAMPWSITGATRFDVERLIELMAAARKQSVGLATMAERWYDYLACGTWRIEDDFYWTLPYDFNDMRCYDGPLYAKLLYSSLIIFKGDLNYRKLVGDINWEPWVPFKTALRSFRPSSLVALRAIKSDLLAGVPLSTQTFMQIPKGWMLTGKFGVVQFAKRKKNVPGLPDPP